MSRTLFAATLLMLLAAPAFAQEPTRYPGLGDGDTTPGTPQLPRDLELTVAVGAAIAPEYMGADDYEFIFDPAIKLEYNQRAFLVVNRQAMMVPYEGLGIKMLANQDYSLGFNLTYDKGRDTDGRIAVLGDMDWTVLGGVFAAYHPGPFFVRGNLGYDLMNEFNSYKGEIGVGYTAPINASLRGMIELDTAFAGENYMDDYFGVSAAQAAASAGRLTAFNPDGGFYRMGLSGTLRYQFTQGAFVSGLARYDWLTGDASDSSVSDDDAMFFLGGNVGYEF